MKNKFLLTIVFTALLFSFSYKNIYASNKALPKRIIQNINENWQYLENNLTDIAELKTHKNWQTINLPHTWNQWDAVDVLPGYRRDASWYQKEIFIEDYEDANYILYFEGANISTKVYVNGLFVKEHVGGYVGFKVDISKQVKKGQKNTISIRVDNSYNRDIIPSQKSDFFIYGGITRDLWLEILPKIYFKNIAITNNNISKQSAETTLDILFNRIDFPDQYIIKSKIVDASSNKVLAKKSMSFDEFKSSPNFSFSKISYPKLWSPDHPNLYKVVTQLLDGQTLIDEKIETTAYRWYRFEAHGAFFLNGERLLLRGTHRHEEHAGYGAAMPNKLHRKDMTDIKEMGANFVRLAHYPQDPEVYKTCDELGIIVWDELPWCRGGMGNGEWQSNTERLLVEQITQHYNHPCIFFWSLGNEIYWLPDFKNGDDEKRLNNFLKKLNSLAHELDNNRLTSIRKYYAGADLVDVFSPSIWSGWYAGVYTNYENTLLKNQKKYPRFLHMEYGGSSHVGRHTENPVSGKGLVNEDDWAEVANQVNVKNIAKTGDWTENYIVDLFDWHLSVSEQMDNFAGNAQWAFKDFGTPLRPENAIPYLNQKGLVDRSGKPKDAYYVFKSYWAKKPFTYIESHSWTERRGPKGKQRNVSVFSNCKKVEFFHNGKSLGKKNRVLGQFPACGLNWDVLFTKGKNVLIANGYKKNKLITSDTLVVNYDFEKAEKADHINLSYRKLANGNYLIEAIMYDKNERRVLDYEKPVYFSKDGAGVLLVNYGTPTRSQVIQMANGRAAIELVPAKKGKAIIEVRNQDFKGSYLVIDFSKDLGFGNLKTKHLQIDQIDFHTKKIIEKANQYLAQAPEPITSFSCERSAGGIHDFYSEGDYWWPDPDNPQGAYIRRDGKTNPQNFVAHRQAMRHLNQWVSTLVAAYQLSHNKKYADQALKHLKAFFINPATRMNPNLLYAQAIKGKVTGRGIGIIDTIHLIEVAKAIQQLIALNYLNKKDSQDFQQWFYKYATWMNTHPYGLKEKNHGNNHSTWWAAQLAAFADLAGNEKLMEVARSQFKKLLSSQMASDGSFPDEIKRTKPYNYTLFNLEGYAVLCQIASDQNNDLWHYKGKNGSIEKAWNFMMPYIKDKSKWFKAPDIQHFEEIPIQTPGLLFAALAYDNNMFLKTWQQLTPERVSEEVNRNFPIREVVLWLEQ